MKFIVYCTTNLKNGKVYIGVHKTQSPYEFDGYIGNGVKVPTKVDKPFHINNPQTPFQRSINKYGYKSFYRSTLAIFDLEEEAYSLEQILVNKAFIADKNSYNIALGGSSPQAKVRSVTQYSLEGKRIKIWNSLTEAHNALGIGIPDIIDSANEISITAGGFVWRYSDMCYSETITVRLRIPSNKGETNAIWVVQYSKSGYRMREFNSIALASSHTNIPSQNISACCNNHLHNKTAGDYQWRFYSDNIQQLSPVDSKTTSKIVEKILNGEVIEEYESSRLASESLGFKNNARQVRKACMDGVEYKGFYWRYKG